MKKRSVAVALSATLILGGCSSLAPDAPPVSATMLRARPQATIQQLNAGRALFVQRCIECHALPAIREHSEEAWPPILTRMAARADLTAADREAVLAYILAVHRQ